MQVELTPPGISPQNGDFPAPCNISLMSSFQQSELSQEAERPLTVEQFSPHCKFPGAGSSPGLCQRGRAHLLEDSVCWILAFFSSLVGTRGKQLFWRVCHPCKTKLAHARGGGEGALSGSKLRSWGGKSVGKS